MLKQIVIFILAIYSSIIFAKSQNTSAIMLPKSELRASIKKNSFLSKNNIITHQQIKTQASNDLTQILQGQSGIQIFHSNGNPQQPTISIRGFGENAFANSLILVDGYPLINPDIGSTEINAINTENIDNIFIQAQSQSVLYGDQAVGGVVHINTREPKHFYSQIKIGYGRFQERFLKAILQDAFSNGLYYTMNTNAEYTKNYRQNNTIDWYQLNTRFGYHNEKTSLYFAYHGLLQNSDLPGALTIQQVRQNGRQASTPNDHVRDKTHIFIFNIKHRINDYLQFNAQLAERLTQFDGRLTSQFNQDRQVTTFYPKFFIRIPLENRYIIFKNGADLEYDYYRFKSTSSFGVFQIRDTRIMGSPYSQLTLPITRRIHLITGVRYAHDETHLNSQNIGHHVFVTEQEIHYLWNKIIKIYIRRAENYRFPKADEQNNFFSQTAVTPLKTQTGISYETGLRFNHPYIKSKIAFYKLDLHNEIAFALPTPFDIRPTNRNLDPTRRTGFIFDLCLRPIKSINIYANYAYTRPIYMSGPFTGKTIPFVARNMARFALSYHYHHWRYFIESILTGQRYAAEDDLNQGRRLGSYTIYNTSISYQFKKFTGSLRLNNFTGKKYYNYALLPTGSQTFYYPAPERQFLFTVSYDIA